MPDNARKKQIVRASWVAVIGNAMLAVLKIFIGIVANSMAVISDGIDSATDIITSIITLVTGKIITKEPDIKFPYGYQRADTIAAKALSFFIFFAGAQLAISTIQRIIAGEEEALPGMAAVYITIGSIAGKLFLSWYLHKKGKKAESSMLIANAQNMRNDIVISVTVLIGLFFTFVLHIAILDKITAIGVSIWVMRSAFIIFFDTNVELMDGYKKSGIYNQIISIVNDVKGANHPHRIRVRKLGNRIIIDMDVEVKGDISVREAHEIVKNVENRIKNEIENVYDVIVHIEPLGNVEKDERFGISEDNLKENKK